MLVKKAKKCTRLLRESSPISSKTLILSNTPSQEEKEGAIYFNPFLVLGEDRGGTSKQAEGASTSQMEEDEVEEFVPLTQ